MKKIQQALDKVLDVIDQELANMEDETEQNELHKSVQLIEETLLGNIKEDEEYIQSIARVHMDYIHSTLQECLNGNVDESMIEYSLQLVEKYRDKR
tara:strand:+ start:3447 stop:3734 length:288 start_codon:yes stop_codon:yes gene_type:complete